MASLPLIQVVPPAAPSAPTRVEGKGIGSGSGRKVELAPPASSRRGAAPKATPSILPTVGFTLGFFVGMAIVMLVARYWLGITHF